MTDQPDSPTALQFEHAEFDRDAAAQARQCAACKGALGARYYLANEHVVCESCSRTLQAGATAGGSGHVRFARAAALGLLAGAVGAGIWFAIALLTGSRWGVVALVVGLLVGGAVRYGAGGRGGAAYQALAIAITYVAIVVTNLPDVLQGLDTGGTVSALQYVLAFGVAAILPFLSLPENIIGVLIIGFALYQAWTMNKRATLVIKGPFEIAR